MKDSSQVLAVLCGDVHLSATPPVWRSTEPDWYAAMGRPLQFLRELCAKYSCPLVIAGDVFDKWNPPPELINWAMVQFHMPWTKVYAIPGQHDLPNHRYEDIKKSGYWTLCEAGVIENLEPNVPIRASVNLMLHGFPWRHNPNPLTYERKEEIEGSLPCHHMAVIHDYCWSEGASFPGCPEEKHVRVWAKKLKGFNSAVFGDNHIHVLFED